MALRARAVPRELESLARWVSPITLRLRENELRWIASRTQGPPGPGAIPALLEAIYASQRRRTNAARRSTTLRNDCRRVRGLDRQRVLWAHLRATVRAPWRLLGDGLALFRDLDEAALQERLDQVKERSGVRIAVTVEVLSYILAQHPVETSPTLLSVLIEVGRQDPRPATRRAAWSALARVARHGAHQGLPLGLEYVAEVASTIQDPTVDPWTRRAALGVLPSLEPARAQALLQTIARLDVGDEAFLIRAKACELVLARAEPWRIEVAQLSLNDPSELVRATVVDALGRLWAAGSMAAGALVTETLQTDAEPRIRARCCAVMQQLPHAPRALALGCADDDDQVVVFALEAAGELARRGTKWPVELLAAVLKRAIGANKPLADKARMAAHLAEKTPVQSTPPVSEVSSLQPGQRVKVQLGPDHTPHDLADALLPATFEGDGFGLDFAGAPTLPGQPVWVRRGEKLGRRSWRLVHELLNPAPAKRQGHSHTIGRSDRPKIRVPSVLLAERTATTVPGRPVYDEAVGGWAPEVPLTDDYLDATRHPVALHTVSGSTVITPPAGTWARWRARARLTWHYERFALLRKRALSAPQEARHLFTSEMEQLGFHTRHSPRHPGASDGFFRSNSLLAYFVTLEGNSLTHLAGIVFALLTFVGVRTVLLTRWIRRARSRIPLVIGGWGSRGKSGTERLKAGMLEGAGVEVLAKTTGCEAMVLHGPPGGHAMELFLFRAFDKVSIWEQARAVDLAQKLEAGCMLWECMALKPRYRDILQQSWMRDDLCTITNAYPDHEDVMGPSGLDVARVIGGFVAPKATAYTTEVDMTPILNEEARRRGTDLVQVSRAERELIPADLMARFPYRAHPYNVALVARVAAELGIEPTEAMGWMAEHVVPDLGALVVTEAVHHEDRSVSFVNGMSANDRLSFLHNWRSTGFADLDPQADPLAFQITVVNNRADRVSRSQVFARVVAFDAAAHRHIVIGTNVRGFKGYVEEAARERVGSLDLSSDRARAELLAHLRIPDAAHFVGALAETRGVDVSDWQRAVRSLTCAQASLKAGRVAAKAIEALAQEVEQRLGLPGLSPWLVQAVAEDVALARAHVSPAPQVAEFFVETLLEHVICLDDSMASGDEVIHHAVTLAPPGAQVRIMGVQNIKGTGLDFVYQWMRLKELQGVLGRTQPVVRLVHALESFPFSSALLIDTALPKLRESSEPAATALVDSLEKRRKRLVAKRGRRRQPGFASFFIWLAERLIDPFDGIRRRTRAMQIFGDLGSRRIGHLRAQQLLQDLTKRQKGGWLGGKA